MMKSVDIKDLNSFAERHAGSTPVRGTILILKHNQYESNYKTNKERTFK